MKKTVLFALIVLLGLQGPGLMAAEEAAATPVKPKVKVYILFGQSNMLGFGKISPADQRGTLEYATQVEKKYLNILDEKGGWAVRKDVRYVHVMQGKPMQILRNEWLTVKPDGMVGPELQLGHLLGDYHEEPVLILKACIGNRSLGWDYLPPGSERFEYRGKMYAGYRDSPFSWVKSDESMPIHWEDAGWYAGKQYDDDTSYAKHVLANLDAFFPEATDYEIEGFCWWQGHKDQSPILAGRYEQNLVHFIKTLRKDFEVPEAFFALATIAFNGRRISGPGLTIVNAQLAVDGDKGKYPEFKGNVKSMDARPFWQPSRRSPGGGGHHYNGNAITYMDVGNALGEAMIALQEGRKK